MKKLFIILLLVIPILGMAFTVPKELGPLQKSSYQVVVYHGLRFFIQYFQFTLPNKTAQKNLNDAILKIVNAQLKGLPEAMLETMKEFPPDFSKFVSYKFNSQITFFGERYISILFKDDAFLCGAHPSGSIHTLNFDMKTGKILKLSDLFSEGTDYISQLSEMVKKDALSSVGQNFMDFKHIKPNQDFVFLSNDTFLLLFQECEYTSCSAGIPKIYIDINSLKGFKLKLNGLVTDIDY